MAITHSIVWCAGATSRAAKILIDAGIDINKAGDLGYTPPHVACIKGNAEMVKLLIERAADIFSLSEGDAPFDSVLVSPATTHAQWRFIAN